MSRIKNIKRTCYACPSQWDIELEDGSELYVRYRWGKFTVSRSQEVVFEKELGGAGFVFMRDERMLELLKEGGIIDGETVKTAG